MSTYTNMRIIMFFTFALSLSACGGGGGGKSANTKIRILPEKPIVFTAPTKDMSGGTIQGPWFSFRMEVSNNTDETVTIQVLEADVSAQDANGQFVTTTATWSASALTKTVTVAGEDFECEFTDFGEIAPGTTQQLSLTNSEPLCATLPEFIVGSNPKGDGENYRYRVKVKPVGWFGTYAVPTDRYQKSATFFTQ